MITLVDMVCPCINIGWLLMTTQRVVSQFLGEDFQALSLMAQMEGEVGVKETWSIHHNNIKLSKIKTFIIV